MGLVSSVVLDSSISFLNRLINLIGMRDHLPHRMRACNSGLGA